MQKTTGRSRRTTQPSAMDSESLRQCLFIVCSTLMSASMGLVVYKIMTFEGTSIRRARLELLLLALFIVSGVGVAATSPP